MSTEGSRCELLALKPTHSSVARMGHVQDSHRGAGVWRGRGGSTGGEADHEVDDGREDEGLDDGHRHLHEAHRPRVRRRRVEARVAVLEPYAAVLQRDGELRQAAKAEEHHDHEDRAEDRPAATAPAAMSDYVFDWMPSIAADSQWSMSECGRRAVINAHRHCG